MGEIFKIFDAPIFAPIKKLFGIGETPLLPADERQARPLTIVVAIMCALGCLAALTARAGFRAAETWTSDLKSAMTVLIDSPRDEVSLNRALVIVQKTPGVKAANIMDKEKAKKLLRNYGANIGVLIDELPLPNIIEVGLDRKIEGTEENLQKNLSGAGFKIEIDDHSRYSGEIIKTSAVLRGFAIMALLSLIVAAITTIAFAARAALESRRDSVEILHLVGAEDEFVAREVQIRFMRLGLVSGAYGALAAGVMVFAGILIMKIGASALTSSNDILKFYDVWILILAPILTAFAASFAARIAARQTLKELV